MSDLYGYSADNFMGQLPAVLYDSRNTFALAEVIAKALESQIGKLPLAVIYSRIDELPEELLDILARDFSIDWYNYDYPVEAKRNLIKTNYYVHKHLGTRGAVKSAVVSVYPHSDVEEWFQYDGEPYHFRIVLESGWPIVPISNTEVLREVYLYKSMRSHLDGIIYRSSQNLSVKCSYGWMTYWGRICGTFPERARLGSIERTTVRVETNTRGTVYENPQTGEIQTGTFPNPAVEGRIFSDKIAVMESAEGIAYQTPHTGEIDTGTFPQNSRIGHISQGEISLIAGTDSVLYQNPASGETESGLFPETVTHGQIFTGDIEASSSGDGMAYDTPICGGNLDSLF